MNIDDAVRVHRVLDAAQKSIAEGRKFVLELIMFDDDFFFALAPRPRMSSLYP